MWPAVSHRYVPFDVTAEYATNPVNKAFISLYHNFLIPRRLNSFSHRGCSVLPFDEKRPVKFSESVKIFASFSLTIKCWLQLRSELLSLRMTSLSLRIWMIAVEYHFSMVLFYVLVFFFFFWVCILLMITIQIKPLKQKESYFPHVVSLHGTVHTI